MKGLASALIMLGILCVSGLGLLLYQTAPSERQRAGESVPAGSAMGDAGSPAAAIGQFTLLDKPRPAPDIAFTTRAGEAARLADFRGRVVLVNLWATWCGPCVREMPSLDRLQARLGRDLAILAISEDRGGAKVVEPFLDRLALTALTAYLDPKGGAGQAFGVRGLPTSFLIDREGRILGELEGAADWDGPAMLGLLKRYLRPTDSPVQKISVTR